MTLSSSLKLKWTAIASSVVILMLINHCINKYKKFKSRSRCSDTSDAVFQGDLRSNLKMKRQKLMLQMQTHGKSTQEMEQQILMAGCKLRTVVEENFKFNEVTEGLLPSFSQPLFIELCLTVRI